MAKNAQDKERIKAERLKEALRANLRRRKAKPPVSGGEPDIAEPSGERDG